MKIRTPSTGATTQSASEFKSDVFEAIASSAQALFKVGAIDAASLRSFEEQGRNASPSADP